MPNECIPPIDICVKLFKLLSNVGVYLCSLFVNPKLYTCSLCVKIID